MLGIKITRMGQGAKTVREFPLPSIERIGQY